MRNAAKVLLASASLALSPWAAAQTGQASKPSPSPAQRQAIVVEISAFASYDDALRCFHYFALARETAKEFAGLESATAEQKAGLAREAELAGYLQSRWSGRISVTKGARTEDQVNADLKRIGDPMTADANNALKGDKAALDRGIATGEKCQDFQTVKKVDPKPG